MGGGEDDVARWLRGGQAYGRHGIGFMGWKGLNGEVEGKNGLNPVAFRRSGVTMRLLSRALI